MPTLTQQSVLCSAIIVSSAAYSDALAIALACTWLATWAAWILWSCVWAVDAQDRATREER